VTLVSAAGCLLENPVYPIGTRHLFLSHPLTRVDDMDGSDNPIGGWPRQGATPENQQETATAGSSEAIRQPSRSDNEMKRWSTPYGDVGNASLKKLAERNSLSGRRNLPLQRAIAEANPANNGEALAHLERVIPWEVESLRLFDPVTTEAKAEMEFLSQDNLRTP
jgi:hypothetical protein